ncbi:MAG: type II toxin-antitoxin system CcdA family antitoxin [Phyllobacteriaceae bacterium]|nr:type II toxin-antitoxin system CcdA family antitoxin [Phyllobacteriaceae bacterium]
MRTTIRQTSARKPSNLSIDASLMERAKALSINVSRAAEAGIAADADAERERLWKVENRPALDAWNDWVDRNGPPLAGYRGF